MAKMFIPLLLCVAAASAACPADSRPRCTSAESIAAGTFSGDTWVPSSECFVAVPSLDEMRRILRGSWLLMCGGSNTHVTFQTILGQLAPHAWEALEATKSWIDVVLNGPDRIYLEGQRWPKGTNETEAVRSAMAAVAKKAPYSENATRITIRDTKFYPACSDLLQEARNPETAAGGWHRSRIVMWTQSGVWYNYMSLQDKYGPDVENFLADATPSCDAKTASGPGTTSCFVFPASCAAPCSNDYVFLNDGLRQGIARSAERESKFAFPDITLQIGQREEEFPQHHVTPFLSLWQFWGLLNTLPEAAPVLDMPGSGGLACPVDTVTFEPRCKLFFGGRKTLRATWEGCDGCDCPAISEKDEEYVCAAGRYCGYSLSQGGRPDPSERASAVGSEKALPSPPHPPPSPPPLSLPPAAPGEEVVTTVSFSLRLLLGTSALTVARPHTSPDAHLKLTKLLQAEEADAVRAAIAGRLPSTSFQPSDVLLQVGLEPDVLMVSVVIPEGSPTAGLLARKILLRETPQSLTPLGDLLVVEVVREPVIEPMTLSRHLVRARAMAQARRPCKPDVAAGLLQAATDLAPRRAAAIAAGGSEAEGSAAAKLANAVPGVDDPLPHDDTEDKAQDGWTATILLVASTVFALAAASAPSVLGWLRSWLCERRTSSEYAESSSLIGRDSAMIQPRPNAGKAAARPEPFVALNGARLLAGMHIVMGHMNQSGYGGGYATTWGFSWVPWFFMLSGYVLTLARHASRNPEAPQSVVGFVQKRAAVIYPPYVVTLFLGLGQLWWEGEALPKYYRLAAQGVLAQSFVPWLPENTVQMHCWFLSCLVPMWLVYDVFVRRVILRLSTLRSSLALLLALAALGFLPMIFPAVIPGGDPDWYRSHHTGSLRTPTDFAVVFLKFHPLAYLHTFAFGAVLARVRHLLGQAMDGTPAPRTVPGAASGVPAGKGDPAAWALTTMLSEEGLFTPVSPPPPPPLSVRTLALVFRLGASIGYLGLVLIFHVPELRPISFKLSARLSVLMLLQGLVLVGLTPLPQQSPLTIFPEDYQPSGSVRARCWYFRDPLEAILAQSPAALGDLSYAQYLMQFLVLRLWPVKPIGSTLELFAFFALLLAASQLLALLVIRPAAKLFLRAKPSTLVAIALLVSLVTSAACLADAHSRRSHDKQTDACGLPLTPPTLLPPYIQIDSEAVDVRLNWTASALEPSKHFGASTAAEASPAPVFALAPALINPSLLWTPDGRLLRAARLHATGCSVHPDQDYNGSRVTEIQTVWRSEIAVDSPAMESPVGQTWLDIQRGDAPESASNSDLASESSTSEPDEVAAGWATWDVSRWELGDSSRPLRLLDLSRGRHSAAAAHPETVEGATTPAGDAPTEPWAPLCQRDAKYVPSNHSLLQTVVTGPEDPKLIPLPSGIGAGIAFSSFPPNDGPYACHDPPSMLFGGNKAKYQMYFASPPLFADNSSAPAALPTKAGKTRALRRAARQMRAALSGAADAPDSPAGPSSHPSALGYRFECQIPYLPNKNWIGFTHAGVLHMVTSVTPHTVQTVREDGRCSVDSYVTDGYEPLRRLAKAVDVRGSASAIPWHNGTAYLALLHTKNKAGRYTTMAYTFDAKQPFAVIAVSRPIPLAAGSSAFASSLSVPPGGGKLVIGYGAADAEARALVVSNAYLESLFDWSRECGATAEAKASGAHAATNIPQVNAAKHEGGGAAPPAPAPDTGVDLARTVRAYQYANLVLALTVFGCATSILLRLIFKAWAWWRVAPLGKSMK